MIRPRFADIIHGSPFTNAAGTIRRARWKKTRRTPRPRMPGSTSAQATSSPPRPSTAQAQGTTALVQGPHNTARFPTYSPFHSIRLYEGCFSTGCWYSRPKACASSPTPTRVTHSDSGALELVFFLMIPLQYTSNPCCGVEGGIAGDAARNYPAQLAIKLNKPISTVLRVVDYG